MKKVIQYMLLCFVLILSNIGCKVDNYDEPNASFGGIVIDKTTGKGISTEQPRGFRIRWTEKSWGDNVQPDYFWAMPDGKFNWNWVFGYNGSEYEILPVDGAFVSPEPQTISIKKGEHKDLTFEVIPYIHIDSEYQLNGRELTVKFTATRPEGSFLQGGTPYAINQVWVLVSNKTKYISLQNTGGYIREMSLRISPFNESRIGQEIEAKIELSEPGTYYFRVAVQTSNPANACNFTDVETVEVQ